MAKSFANAKRGQVNTGESVTFTKAVDISTGLTPKVRYKPLLRMAGTKWKVSNRQKKSSGGSGG